MIVLTKYGRKLGTRSSCDLKNPWNCHDDNVLWKALNYLLKKFDNIRYFLLLYS